MITARYIFIGQGLCVDFLLCTQKLMKIILHLHMSAIPWCLAAPNIQTDQADFPCGHPHEGLPEVTVLPRPEASVHVFVACI